MNWTRILQYVYVKGSIYEYFHFNSSLICTCSSQVLFSISQKLIQHQIMNYTDILKWLRDILMCRNAFLLRHKDYANLGSQIAICKQAHIKLEVSGFFLNTCWGMCFEIVKFKVFHSYPPSPVILILKFIILLWYLKCNIE